MPEYWSGFLSPGDLPNPGIESRSPTLQADSLPVKPPGKPKNTGVSSLSLLQWIFPTQELNWGLLHCRGILYQLSYLGSSLLWRAIPCIIQHLAAFLASSHLMPVTSLSFPAMKIKNISRHCQISWRPGGERDVKSLPLLLLRTPALVSSSLLYCFLGVNYHSEQRWSKGQMPL